MQKKLFKIELDESTKITEKQLQGLQTIVPKARFRSKYQVTYKSENWDDSDEAKWAEYNSSTHKSFCIPYGTTSLDLVDLNYFLSLQLDIPFTVKKIINIRFGTKNGRYSNNTFI